jgi:hypothetical protein
MLYPSNNQCSSQEEADPPLDYFDYFYAKMVTWEHLFMFPNAGFLLSRAICHLLPIRILINR